MENTQSTFTVPGKRKVLNIQSEDSILEFILSPSDFQPKLSPDAAFSFNSALEAAAVLRQMLYADASNIRVFKDAVIKYKIEEDIPQLSQKKRNTLLDNIGSLLREFTLLANNFEKEASTQLTR